MSERHRRKSWHAIGRGPRMLEEFQTIRIQGLAVKTEVGAVSHRLKSWMCRAIDLTASKRFDSFLLNIK
jgi:hypothetical protein